MISTEQRQFEKWMLTAEGEEMVQYGSHEARLFNAVDPQNGSIQAELMVCVCVWVGGGGGGGGTCITHNVYGENIDLSTLQILACRSSYVLLFHLLPTLQYLLGCISLVVHVYSE